MPENFDLDLETLNQWLPPRLYQKHLSLVMARVGMTKRRAECFLRLWLYLLLKERCQQLLLTTPPLTSLTFPGGLIECSCREAAKIFYGDQERGSDRSAGMMLDKLVALGLIRKQFDGNCTQIELLPLPELLDLEKMPTSVPTATPDDFDPRCDAIPIANLLSNNYNWLSRNTEAVPYRIANILRDWAARYGTGMRVLRRHDNQNPVGFYVLYPTQRDSEINFFAAPSRGLHLSQVADVDPFKVASSGDLHCRAVFVRSFMVEKLYQLPCQVAFLQDAQITLTKMRQDFPNLMDMYTLIIHPSYAELARSLGFQKTGADPKLPIQWMYQAVDRFIALDIQ